MLAAHAEEINDLNVFPVPDGDTGTNMARTIEGGISQSEKEGPQDSIGKFSKSFSRGALLSARGNSGVILSQIFAGINEGLESHDTVDAGELADAFRMGISKSYAAVRNPTEGTILTVFRESTEYAASRIGEESSVEDFLRFHIDEARRSLRATKEILPVLAEADVVDSGAAGYLYIAEGMFDALTGKSIQSASRDLSKPDSDVDIDLFTRDSVLEFGYCTEFLLRLTTAKVDPDSFRIDTVLGDLEALKGESVVAYKEGDIIKVHVHTFRPGDVLAKMQDYGEFLTVKIENMSVCHSDPPKAPSKPAAARKKLAVVAVSNGDGLSGLFKEMGADRIVSGGQTCNPSIEEFIEAFRSCPADNIIVLPNNSNIILTARQAADLYTDSAVYVVETKSLIQGYSALSVITPGITDMEVLTANALRAASEVTECEVTCAVRDAVIDGRKISKGEYMAISRGKIAATADTAEDAVTAMLGQCEDMDMCELITVFTGKNVPEDRAGELAEKLEETYEDCEVRVFCGGQDVYDYYIAAE